jgi:hypothetical protein
VAVGHSLAKRPPSLSTVHDTTIARHLRRLLPCYGWNYCIELKCINFTHFYWPHHVVLGRKYIDEPSFDSIWHHSASFIKLYPNTTHSPSTPPQYPHKDHPVIIKTVILTPRCCLYTLLQRLRRWDEALVDRSVTPSLAPKCTNMNRFFKDADSGHEYYPRFPYGLPRTLSDPNAVLMYYYSVRWLGEMSPEE